MPIICNVRDRKNVSFTGIPRFVMEVLSDATEQYDRKEKMEIYCKVGVSEYWIADWRKKQDKLWGPLADAGGFLHLGALRAFFVVCLIVIKINSINGY